MEENYKYDPERLHFIVDGEELLGDEREEFVETYSENPYWAENLQIRMWCDKQSSNYLKQPFDAWKKT